MNTSEIKSGRQRGLKSGARRMIDNYETSETQQNWDRVVLYKKEERLRQLQNKTGVSELAGGIAHHFNNILTVVIGYGTLLQMKMDQDNPLRTYVEHILSSSEMAADLTKKLLVFSGQQKISPRIANLNEIVRGAQRLFPLYINDGIKLQMELTDQDLLVMIDTACFEEAMVDLISNAVDAMPHGGTLTVTTECLKLGSNLMDGKHNEKPVGCTILTVTDTGIGMTREVKERMFDPFFTTKEVGKGTGLGLSAVYGIVKQLNGSIKIKSQVEKGTEIKIYLPLARPETKQTT
jgi:signal transduction histidine kinase